MSRCKIPVISFLVIAVLLFSTVFRAEARKSRTSYERLMDAVVVVRPPDSVGTGFFVTKNGLIVTNQHVVGDNDTVGIELRDGRKLTGKVLGVADGVDLALVSVPVKAPHWLRLAKPNETVVGMEVIAIGTAMGLSWSVSRGIVSGLREMDQEKLVQTDAAINPGNSGGPLINKRTGRVLGVNTKGVSKAVAEGINFAITADTVRKALAADRMFGKQKAKSNKGNHPHIQGSMHLVDIKHGRFRRDDGETVFLVAGKIKNLHADSRCNILMGVGFADEKGKTLHSELLYGGHFFNPKAIETIDMERINGLLSSPRTPRGKPIFVEPNKSIPFLAVLRFTPFVGKAKKWGINIVDSKPYEKGSKKRPPQTSLVSAQLAHWSAQTVAYRSGGGAVAAQSTAQPDELHGNTRSKVLHKAGCRHYMCRSCTAVFKTREEAIAAGYRPCRRCKP